MSVAPSYGKLCGAVAILLVCAALDAATAPSQPELNYLSSILPDIQARSWEKAERELTSGLQQFPQSAVLSNALGIVYENENKREEAIRAFERAVEWLPNFTAAQLHLATLLAGTGSCKRAIPLFVAAGGSTSDTAALDAAGIGLAQCGDRAGSIQVLEKAHQLNPQSSATTFNLAFADYQNNDFSGSLATLDSLPDGAEQQRPEVLFLRGNVLHALKRPGAAEAMSAACRARPDEEYCNQAAIELIRGERFTEAVTLLQTGKSISSPATTLSTLGLAQFRLGRYSDAIDSYSKAIDKDPTFEAPREGLAFLLYMTGDLERARAVAEAGLTMPNPGFYLFYLKALVLYRQSRQFWPQAVSSLQSAIHRNSRFAPSYFLRGKISMEEGLAGKALDDFKTAIDLDPSYALPYYKMAQIFARQGAPEKAEAAQQKFIELGSLREEEVLARQTQNQLLSVAH